MKDTLKAIGSFLFAICFLVGVVFMVMMFFRGSVWLSERIYPWLVVLTAVTFFVVIFVLLPMAIFRRTRVFAIMGLYISSYVFSLMLWVSSLLTSYTIWGVTGVVVGVFLGGIGVVPVAVLATLFAGMWSVAGQLLLMTAIAIGTKFLGFWLMMKSEDRDHTPVTVGLPR